MEALLYGVADTLMHGGVITEEALREQTRRASHELVEKGESTARAR